MNPAAPTGCRIFVFPQFAFKHACNLHRLSLLATAISSKSHLTDESGKNHMKDESVLK